jgi:hypothetical protein
MHTCMYVCMYGSFTNLVSNLIYISFFSSIDLDVIHTIELIYLINGWYNISNTQLIYFIKYHLLVFFIIS